METLAIALGALVLYIVAYHTYGRWLSRKIFKLDPKAVVPSVELEDGKDFVPTSKSIVFGHHFTSIAGTGPIVGPAVAVIWGWVPALLWVLFGSIFIGAVHDLGALVVSMRNKGQTVGDIAGRVLVPRARILFLGILFMAITVVLAIFGLVIAAVFRQFPQSIMACLLQIPLAVGIGYALHKRGASILIPSLLALGLMYLTVYYSDAGWLHGINQWLAAMPIMNWVVLLLAYSYVASVLPVWILLQPRDYINSLQLLSVLALIMIGAFVDGSANFLMALGLAPKFAIALMGVFVASFAATTLDTACRLQRYVVQELAHTLGGAQAGRLRRSALRVLENKHGATVFAILVALAIAAVPPGNEAWTWTGAGKGGLLLWPIFGATNQLLGGLAFVVVAFWMWRRSLPVWFIVLPMVCMLVLPGLAMCLNIFGSHGYWAGERWLLCALGIASIALEVWIIVEACLAWPKAKGVLEPSPKRFPSLDSAGGMHGT